MIEPETLNTYLMFIKDELRKAEAKHPVFCDDLMDDSVNFENLELHFKVERNSAGPYHAEDLLQEEIMEAMVAYRAGRPEDCLQELAQCGAVILRMMEFVRNEVSNR